MQRLEALVDTKKAAAVLAGVALLAATFALIADFSGIVKAATPLGVAFSGISGVAGGALAARTFPGGAAIGAAAGFTNALVGVLVVMFLHGASWAALLGGTFGGALLGALTGVLGHLLVLVVKRRGTPMRR